MGRPELQQFRQLWPEKDDERLFPVRFNRHYGQLGEPLVAWATNIGIAPERTAAEFDKVDYAAYAAFIYPKATSVTDLLLMAQWQAWYFLFDNHLDEHSLSDIPPETLTFLGDLDQIITTAPSRSVNPNTYRSPYARAARDLWVRSRDTFTSPGWQRRFCAHMHRYQRGQQWELFTRASGQCLDFTTYTENKRYSTGAMAGLSFAELTTDEQLPDAYPDSFLLTTMCSAAADLPAAATDIISRFREQNRFDPIPNSITTLERDLAGTTLDPLTVFRAQWLARAHWLRDATNDLPRLLRALGHDPCHDSAAHDYVNAMLLWVAGNMEWVSRTLRYDATYVGDAAMAILTR